MDVYHLHVALLGLCLHASNGPSHLPNQKGLPATLALQHSLPWLVHRRHCSLGIGVHEVLFCPRPIGSAFPMLLGCVAEACTVSLFLSVQSAVQSRHLDFVVPFVVDMR